MALDENLHVKPCGVYGYLQAYGLIRERVREAFGVYGNLQWYGLRRELVCEAFWVYGYLQAHRYEQIREALPTLSSSELQTLQPTPHTADTATAARALPTLQPLPGHTACSNERACVCVSMHCVPGWKPARVGDLCLASLSFRQPSGPERLHRVWLSLS